MTPDEESGSVTAVDAGEVPPAMDPTVYLRRVEPLLLELEASWERGAAGPVLEECSRLLEPCTLEGYRVLIQKTNSPPTFRRPLLAKLLKQFAHDLRPPMHVFAAHTNPPSDPPPAEPGLRAPSPSGLFVESGEVLRIRLSQAFAARRWGVWYSLGSPELQARLDASWSRSIIESFEVTLRAINRLQGGLRLDGGARNEESVGVWFEQLILDILNEETQLARRAPLHEDLYEKTDLRVSYRTLDRRRGARIQVTFLTDEVRHGTKLWRIKHGEECVVVSPLMLAGAVLGLTGMPSFTHAHRDGLFAALPRSARTVDEVAMALKSHFLHALGHPASPLGPVLSVAAPIRRFIRSYVEHEAHSATRQLRRREARHGTHRYDWARR